MLKKLASILVLLVLCFSCLFPTAAMAVTAQKPNTIVLEMGSSTSDDLKDLRYSEGKLFKKITSAVERLKDAGEVDEEAQPVIIVVTKKKSSSSSSFNF